MNCRLASKGAGGGELILPLRGAASKLRDRSLLADDEDAAALLKASSIKERRPGRYLAVACDSLCAGPTLRCSASEGHGPHMPVPSE